MTSEVVRLVPRDELPLSGRVAMNVRMLMAGLNLQQADAARALNISQQSVSLKLHGKRPITLDEVEQFAAFFGVDPSELLAARAPHPTGPAAATASSAD